MDPHPHQAEADEADPDKQSTPAGFAPDLEDKAEEIGASTDDSPPAVGSEPGALRIGSRALM